MKKNTIYFVIGINFLVIIGLFIFLIGLNKSKEGEIIIQKDSLKNVEIQDAKISEEIVQEHKVKFSHFDEFSTKRNDDKENNPYKSYGFYNDKTREGFTLMIYTENEEESVEDLMYSLANGLRINTNIENSSVKVYEDAKIGNKEAFKLMYKNVDNMNVYEIVTIYDNKQYIFMYYGFDDTFKKEKGDFLFTKIDFIEE